MSKNNILIAIIIFMLIVVTLATTYLIHLNTKADINIVEPKYINNRTMDINVPILLYHHFVETEEEVTEPGVIVTKTNFEKNIKQLLDNGYTFVNLEDIYDHHYLNKPLPNKPVCLTIDDGYDSNYTIAFPILKQYNVKADIFIVTSSVGFKNIDGYTDHFTWEAAKEMEDSGLVNIYSHGKIHTDNSKMELSELKNNYLDSYSDILEHLGNRKRFYAYAGGNFSKDTIQTLANAGCVTQFVFSYSFKEINENMNALCRITVDDNSDILKTIELFNQQLAKK